MLAQTGQKGITEVDHALTELDVKALRQADTVCLDYCSDGVGTIEGTAQGQLRASKKVKGSAFNEEVTRYIPANTIVEAFARVEGGYKYGCAVIHFANDNHYGVWSTIADLLRPGDILTIRWLAGNNNQHLERAGYFNDEVQLIVKRGKRRMAFNVENRIGPDNSARMIKATRY